MSIHPPPSAATEVGTDDSHVVRTRDADGTRQRLLDAARRRFAKDGYTSTTVRDIASDAGVNVALISRYFGSKDGLFEACLTRAGEVLRQSDGETITIQSIVQSVVDQTADSSAGDGSLQLLLLLRSSGDERAEQIRHSLLQTFAERMASVTGWSPEVDGDNSVLLRAQLALATTLGLTLLRTSTALEPLRSATAEELGAPLADLFDTLLSSPA